MASWSATAIPDQEGKSVLALLSTLKLVNSLIGVRSGGPSFRSSVRTLALPYLLLVLARNVCTVGFRCFSHLSSKSVWSSFRWKTKWLWTEEMVRNRECIYRARQKNGSQVAIIFQARPGRSGKQQQEQNSRNLGTVFSPGPVLLSARPGESRRQMTC